jgi:hypothetical protein
MIVPPRNKLFCRSGRFPPQLFEFHRKVPCYDPPLAFYRKRRTPAWMASAVEKEGR